MARPFLSPVSGRICAIVIRHGVSASQTKSHSEDELYEYAVGSGRRMRTVAELKRLMRARIEEAESEYGRPWWSW